ncbi:MAG: type II toxin-antitoxin system Phd/YefM family antitoxin [Actinomycetota bacterium]
MTASIIEDFKSVSDLKKKTSEIFKQIRHTGRPVFITVNGKPNAVLIDIDVFEKKLKALNLGILLNEAEENVKNGNIRSARDFLEELKLSEKL